VGNSAARNEIDILAKIQNELLAVECKNYREAKIGFI
jgi:Holliday junction resolvase